MATQQEVLDRINRAFGGRGLQASGLRGQALNRALLPTLRESITKTDRPSATQRLERLQRAIRENRPEAPRGGRQSQQFDLGSQPFNLLKVSSADGPRKFELEIAGGVGTNEAPRTFETLEEVRSFLRSNPEIAGSTILSGFNERSTLTGDEETFLREGTSANLQRFSVPAIARARGVKSSGIPLRAVAPQSSQRRPVGERLEAFTAQPSERALKARKIDADIALGRRGNEEQRRTAIQTIDERLGSI